MFAYVISEVSTVQHVHHQVQVFTILECVVHIDDERVVELSENLSFIHDGLDTAFGDDASLRHLLHSVLLFGLLTLYLPHLPKPSFSDAVQVSEIAFG